MFKLECSGVVFGIGIMRRVLVVWLLWPFEAFWITSPDEEGMGRLSLCVLYM